MNLKLFLVLVLVIEPRDLSCWTRILQMSYIFRYTALQQTFWSVLSYEVRFSYAVSAFVSLILVPFSYFPNIKHSPVFLAPPLLFIFTLRAYLPFHSSVGRAQLISVQFYSVYHICGCLCFSLVSLRLFSSHSTDHSMMKEGACIKM